VDDDGAVFVVRVLHAAMLPELHLAGVELADGDEDDE
jgi:hypothetical protein